jgi:hypothetical protein
MLQASWRVAIESVNGLMSHSASDLPVPVDELGSSQADRAMWAAGMQVKEFTGRGGWFRWAIRHWAA